jgi:hypothetical protein
MRRARQRIFALIAVTVIAAIVGVVSFMVWPDTPPAPQMQTAVDASSTQTAPEAMVQGPLPVVAPAQATEGTRRKITRQPSAGHDRSLYIELRLR